MENLIRLSIFILIFIGLPILADQIINNVSEEVMLKGIYLTLGLATIHFWKEGNK